MKKLLVILILFSVMVMAGCTMLNRTKDHLSLLDRPTLVDSGEERDFRIGQIDDFHGRMLIDDWDSLWLRDRSSNLSYWTARVGQ